MSFRKGKRLPDNIKDLNFGDLHNSQVYVLADYLGVRRQVTVQNSEEKRRETLKAYCMERPVEAQAGYSVICLHRSPSGAPVPTQDSEQKLYGIVGAAIDSARDKLDEYGKGVFNKHLDTVIKGLDDVKKEMKADAKRYLVEAASNYKPFVVQDKGKTRKVTGVLPPEFEMMVQLASARIPIMLVGPAGCGKTYLCEKLAVALGMKFSDQSCSEGMSESVFNGLLLPIGKGGEFKHVESPFMERYENGGVMLLDEIDAGDANLFTYINKAIANESYTVPQRFQKPIIKKHSDFVLVSAANTFGNGAEAMYVGRNQLDAATLDRFKVGLLTLDYNRDVEMSLAPLNLCEWAWSIRDKIREKKIRRIMSTRVIKNLGDMTTMYKWGPKEWDKAYFTGWSPAEISLIRGRGIV